MIDRSAGIARWLSCSIMLAARSSISPFRPDTMPAMRRRKSMVSDAGFGGSGTTVADIYDASR
jgi:hypothetical protein